MLGKLDISLSLHACLSGTPSQGVMCDHGGTVSRDSVQFVYHEGTQYLSNDTHSVVLICHLGITTMRHICLNRDLHTLIVCLNMDLTRTVCLHRDLTRIVWDTKRWQQRDSGLLDIPVGAVWGSVNSLPASLGPSEPSSPTRPGPLSPMRTQPEPNSPSVIRPKACVALIMSPDGGSVATVHTNELVRALCFLLFVHLQSFHQS